MPSKTSIATTLQALFPADVAVHYSNSLPADAALLPDELAGTDRMVEKRRLEFTHGRHCARRAFAQLGLPSAAVIKGEDRAPRWPAGVTGSISHCGSVAAAAVARETAFRSLGIDIETVAPLDDDLRRLILRPEEESGTDAATAKLIFSIKEAIYKCIHPVVQQYVDFNEMEVDLSGTPGTFRALPHSAKWSPDLIATLEGRYTVTEEWVLSGAWMRQP